MVRTVHRGGHPLVEAASDSVLRREDMGGLPATNLWTPDDGVAESPVVAFLARFGPAVVAGWLAAATGAVMVIVGYYQISATTVVSTQLAYFSSTGVGGLFLLGVGAVLILGERCLATERVVRRLSARQAETERRLGEIVDLLSGRAPVPGNGDGDGPRWRTTVPVPMVLRAGASGSTFHRQDCPFVARAAQPEPLSLSEAIDAGLQPCRLCQPGS